MRRTIFAVLFLLLPLPAAAQFTTVSGTVKGTDGIAYAGGQIKMQLVTTAGSPVSGQPTVTVNNQAQCVSSGFGSAPCQVPFQGTVGPLALSPTGGFTINLQDNTLVTPAATQWLFTVNNTGSPPPVGTGPQVCIAQFTISGAAQTVTGALASCPALSALSTSTSTTFLGPNPWFDVTNPAYGAVADSKVGFRCNFTASTHTLVCPDVTFAAGDVGNVIFVYGANSNATNSMTALRTTISSFTNSTTVVLTTCANTAGCPTGSEQNAFETWVQMVGPSDNFPAFSAVFVAACAAANNSTVPVIVRVPPPKIVGGAYGMASPIIPNCGNYRFTGEGAKPILFRTTFTSNFTTPGGVYTSAGDDGHGFSMVFLTSGLPGTDVFSGVSITAGTNTLTCTGCTFTAADVGKPLYLAYGGYNQLPLWTVISVFTDSTHVSLRDNAQTTMPFANPGTLFTPHIIYGYVKLRNIEIDNLELENVGYRQVAAGTPGLALLIHGADNLSIKQGFKLHDMVMRSLSMTPGFSGNGVLDQFRIYNNQFQTCWDTAFYITGLVSNGWFGPANQITCEEFPFNGTNFNLMAHGTLTKNWTHGWIYDNTFNGPFAISGIAISDWPHFDVRIEGNKVNCQNIGGAAGIGGNIGQRTWTLNNDVQNCPGGGIAFSSNNVIKTVIRGDTISNSGGCINLNDTGTVGHGPSTTIMEHTRCDNSNGSAFSFSNVEGINIVRNNTIRWDTVNGNVAFNVSTGLSGGLTQVVDNFENGSSGSSVFDWGFQFGAMENRGWFASTPPCVYCVVTQSTANGGVVSASAATTGSVYGVVVNESNPTGGTGNAMVLKEGRAWVLTDGALTLGDYVQKSSVVAGLVHDTASAAVPAATTGIGTVRLNIAGVAVLTTVNAGIVCNAASPVVCTVTTNAGAAHNLVAGEPFTIIGATFGTANFACVTTTVPSATTFTFTAGAFGGCPSPAANATGNSGTIFAPQLINLELVQH